MQWIFKKEQYEYLAPDLSKNIYSLDEQEAATYFEWFINQVPQRVAYIAKMCAIDLHIRPECMDCSPESLVLLWKWFRNRAKLDRVTNSQNGDIGIKKCGNFCSNKYQLSMETEYILRDIGMYLGETFRKNCNSIYWTYYTKPERDAFVNHPLLKGFVDRSCGELFYASFEPIHMSRMQALKLINGNSRDNDLLNIYRIWSAMV